jgi:DNA replication initiation complex subunit (GINS family)
MPGINITYETLFEILRREKLREELQKLDPSFFQDVLNYMKEKKALIEVQRSKEDLFAREELQKALIQETNIKRILKEFYERREKKILNMAIDTSRTGSILDTSVLLEQEKKLYEVLLNVLTDFRKGILNNLLNLQEINIQQTQIEQKIEQKPQEKPRETKLIRFLHPVPKFLGENLEEYGPFEPEDMANIPIKLADVLIEKQRAEHMDDYN